MSIRRQLCLAAGFALATAAAHAQYSDGVIKIGVMNDQSGTYADLALQGAPVRAHTGHIVLAPTGLGEVTSLLVRPDGYIAWASADAPAREDAQLAIKRCLAVD